MLAAQIAGLDKIDDAPEVEQAVFQRRAGDGQAAFSFELFDGLGDLGVGVFDELGFVEHDGAEGVFLEFLQVAPQESVVGDDEVVRGDLLAQIMPGRAAFKDQDFEVGDEAVGFAEPVVQD